KATSPFAMVSFPMRRCAWRGSAARADALYTPIQRDQCASGSDGEQRSNDLVDTYAAEHQVRVFAQRLQKKPPEPVPCKHSQGVAAERECARPECQESCKPNEPPRHLQKLHRQAPLRSSVDVVQAHADRTGRRSPHATAVEHAAKPDPEPAGQYPTRHVIPQDNCRNVEPSCCNEGSVRSRIISASIAARAGGC